MPYRGTRHRFAHCVTQQYPRISSQQPLTLFDAYDIIFISVMNVFIIPEY